MKKFAVVGQTLSHSLSPIIFETAFKHLGLDYSYLKQEVKEGELGNIVDRLRSGEFNGLSITVPFKKKIISYLDSLTDEAKAIGAVNFVYISDGRVVGGNTDWIGFYRALTEVVEVKGKNILIYGAGGAARACLFALANREANIFLTNRTKERGESLTKEFNVQYVNSANLPKVDILINATSSGLTDPGELLVTKKWLSKVDVVFDLFYGESALVKEAKGQGLKIIDGKKMLLHQAALQFKIFTSIEAPIKVMERALGL
jgi:shikimate dehydrogenase